MVRQDESLGALKTGFPIALRVIYALLAIPFRSYLQPVVVMSAIPFGLVGAVGGHLIMGYDLSLISIMGIVATSGIVVNDVLVLVHAANALRRDGHSAFDAVRLAGARRFRPILFTSLTTFIGLAPMILETSVQARFLIPMAISLGFGVLFATFIILVLVPAFYLVLEDIIRLVLGMPEDAKATHATPEPVGSTRPEAALRSAATDHRDGYDSGRPRRHGGRARVGAAWPRHRRLGAERADQELERLER